MLRLIFYKNSILGGLSSVATFQSARPEPTNSGLNLWTSRSASGFSHLPFTGGLRAGTSFIGVRGTSSTLFVVGAEGFLLPLQIVPSGPESSSDASFHLPLRKALQLFRIGVFAAGGKGPVLSHARGSGFILELAEDGASCSPDDGLAVSFVNFFAAC
jgi:hypothetical protein